VVTILPKLDAEGYALDRFNKRLAHQEDLDALEAYVDSAVGTPGGGRRMVFSTPSATWTWVHNLGVRPSVTCTMEGEVVIPDTSYPDDNTITIQFDSPVTGYLDIS